MRIFCYIFLLVVCCAVIYAQPTLLAPSNSVSPTVITTNPTFIWSEVSGATQYEFYVTSGYLDTALSKRSTVPFSPVNRYKRYVSFGSASTDTVMTLADTVLAKNTTYWWKVRAKVGGSWGLWAYPYHTFKVGSPSPTMANANVSIKFNHDTLGAITNMRYVQGSGMQLLDTTYNTTNLLGLGGNGPLAQRDTAISWYTSTNTDTMIFTYQNAPKYGSNGLKVMTVARGTDGITVDIVLFLGNGKSVNMSTAWKPGGDVVTGNDNVLMVKTTPSKTQLTYPGTAASFGPDSMTLSAMYDRRYNEYFGFKSDSLIAVRDTQKTGLLKQTLSFNNATVGYKTFTFGFAVRQTRAEFFDTWADNRPMLVTAPAAGDSLTSRTKYVIWESFGASPASIDFSTDGGTTFSGSASITKDTTQIDSAQYTMNSGPKRNNCVLRVTSSHSDVAQSGVFILDAPFGSVTSPGSGVTLATGSHYVVWNNGTGGTLTKVDLSLDSGITYSNVQNISSSTVDDSVLYTYYGGKTASQYCVVRVYNAAGDTLHSGIFSLGKGTAIFSIPTVFGDPQGIVQVPISITDYLTGDSLKSFDIKLTFDSTYSKFDSLHYNASLNNWVHLMDSSNYQTTTSNYVRVAAFKNVTGVGVKSSEILRLYFTIKGDQSLIGGTDSLRIKNSVLAASGNGAYSLDVSSSTNGALKVYSSIAGYVRYFHEDSVGGPSYTISGDSLINYFDITHSVNNSSWSIVNGYFKLTGREPNDVVNFYPMSSKYMASGLGNIDVTDAMLAFADWYTPLSTRAKLTADVNEDSVVNTTDAMAIMEISVDSTYLTGIGLSNWIFIDSTSLAGFESRSDSLTAWYTEHKHAITYTLTNQEINQDFWGVLRGDVNFSYGSADITTMKKKSVTEPAIFCTEANFNLKPGDEVWIPLNLSLGEKNAIGGFNASMKVNPKILSYTGEFKRGSSIPQDKNWYITAKSDAGGTLRIAGVDFSRYVTPITQDGPALLFKYTVRKDAKLGSTGIIDVQTQTVVDKNMQKVASAVKSGHVEITRMGSAVVTTYELSQNYPNPFNPSTTIEYALPLESKVDIEIFNILGQKTTTLFSGVQKSGYHQVEWNASRLSSGVYFYVMKASSVTGETSFQKVKKLVLMK